MAAAIDELLVEHRVIEEVLGSLETFLASLGEHPEQERGAIRDYARVFLGLDNCHHGKEEHYLFAKMTAYGFSRDGGPVSAMLSEQGEGRDHLDALAAIGQGEGALTPAEREVANGHALGYILRIRPHMKREEDILFPIILHSLPGFVLDELARDFADFEKNALPVGFIEEIRSISQNLIEAYPPNSGSSLRRGRVEHSPRNE